VNSFGISLILKNQKMVKDIDTLGIKILLVDDHPIFLDGIHAILDTNDDFIISGEAKNGFEAIDLVHEDQPDIIVMDVAMPELNGIEATRKIMELYPDTKILALSIYSSKRFIKDMLEAGAVGYLLKDNAPEKLVTAIYRIANGDTYINRSISNMEFGLGGLID
jgi:DNA-binding NarL/FixJ family response regulator